MLKKCCLFFTVLVLAHTMAFSQSDTLTKGRLVDTDYIRTYNDEINLSIINGTQNMRYRLSDADNVKFIFSPNQIYGTGFNVSYSFIDFTYTFSTRLINIENSDIKKGKTTSNGLKLNFRANRFKGKIEINNIKGFYLHNTSDFYDGWKPGDPYIQFPTLHIKQVGGSISYNANKHYSVATLNGGNEQQLKTAFSFLPALNVYHFKITDDDTAVVAGNNDYTSDWDISLNAPVAATFVFAKNWYVSANVGPSLGIDAITSTLVEEDEKVVTQKQTFISLGYAGRLSAGWSNRKYFAGIDAGMRRYTHNDHDNVVTEKSFYNAEIYFGFRFAAPTFIKNGATWVKKILPL